METDIENLRLIRENTQKALRKTGVKLLVIPQQTRIKVATYRP